jgi:hypothetical protein
VVRPPHPLAAPLTAQTRGLVDATVLDVMKADAHLVNIARGPMVDESALLAALNERRIGGATLDVFDTEPLPPEHPLWDAPNVTITAHMSADVVGWRDTLATQFAVCVFFLVANRCSTSWTRSSATSPGVTHDPGGGELVDGYRRPSWSRSPGGVGRGRYLRPAGECLRLVVREAAPAGQAVGGAVALNAARSRRRRPDIDQGRLDPRLAYSARQLSDRRGGPGGGRLVRGAAAETGSLLERPRHRSTRGGVTDSPRRHRQSGTPQDVRRIQRRQRIWWGSAWDRGRRH